MVALAVAAVLGGVVLGVVAVASGSSSAGAHPAGTLIATLIQDVVFVGTAVLLGAWASTASAEDLGLRVAPVRRVAVVTATTGLGFLVFSMAYDAVVRPEAQQDTLQALGADRGTLWMLASAVLVVGVAPFAEEVLFRGFMYRCLRNRFSTAIASTAIGLVFGAIHYDGADVLPLLPLLAVFGAALCWAYERAGTLYSPILLHAVNNAIAFAATGPDGAPLAAPVILAASAAICLVGVRGQRRRRVGDPAVAA